MPFPDWVPLLGGTNNSVVSHTSLSQAVGEALAVGDVICIAVEFNTSGGGATDGSLDNTGTGTVVFRRRVETAGSFGQKGELWEGIVTAAGTPTVRLRYLPTPGTTTANDASLIVDPFTGEEVAPDVVFTTSFDGSENPLIEGGRWNNLDITNTKVQKVSGAAYGTQDVTGAGQYAPFDDSTAYARGYGPNHEVEGTIVLAGGLPADPNLEVALRVRWREDQARKSTSFDDTYTHGYAWSMAHDGNYSVLGRHKDAVALLEVTTPPTPANGDTFRMRIEGRRIRAWWNATLLGEVTDEADGQVGQGNPGFGFFVNTSGTDPSNTDFGFSAMTVRHLAHSARVQAAPGTPTDAISSYMWKTLERGSLIYGAYACVSDFPADPGTVGTGFTHLRDSGGIILKSMYRVQRDAGVVGITATAAAATGDDTFLVMGMSVSPVLPAVAGFTAGGGFVAGDFASFGGEAMGGADTAGGAAQLAASAVISVAAAGALTTEIRMAASAAIALTTAAVLTTEIPLAGAAAVAVSSAGALTTEIALAATAPVTLTAIGALTTDITMVAGASVAFAGTGALTTEIRLVGAGSVAFTTAADLQVEASLAGAAAIVVTSSSALTTEIRLAGAATVGLAGVGALTTEVRLVGSGTVAFAVAAALTTELRLVGAGTVTFTTSSALTTEISFAGAVTVAFAAAGSLLTAITLVGAATIIFDATANFIPPTVVGRPPYGVTLTGELGVIGEAALEVALSGSTGVTLT